MIEDLAKDFMTLIRIAFNALPNICTMRNQSTIILVFGNSLEIKLMLPAFKSTVMILTANQAALGKALKYFVRNCDFRL